MSGDVPGVSAGGAVAGAGRVTVRLAAGGLGPAHAHRYVERAMYSMMADAAESGEPLSMTPVRLFRPDESRPAVDDFIMDEDIVSNILKKIRQADPV